VAWALRAYTRAMSRRLALALCIVAACRAEAPSQVDERVAPSIRDGGTEIPERFVVGLAPFLPEEDMRREYSALTEYLGKRVGLPAEIELADSYAALAELLASFKVHLAVMPPFAYVQAKRDNPGLILVASAIADGSSTYASYIVTRDDTGIDTIEQLRGKRFAFVDRQSTSGYLYPMAYLRELDMNPDNFFSEVRFGGDHVKVLDLVLSRQVEAGATYSTAFKLALAERADGKRLRILAKTGRIPLDAYCVSQRLDRGLVDKVRDGLLTLSTRSEEGRNVLSGLSSINGFLTVGDDHYDEVRRAQRRLEEAR
jgi:phosphate/phosphite/phosphonate ABC transporter binding protein